MKCYACLKRSRDKNRNVCWKCQRKVDRAIDQLKKQGAIKINRSVKKAVKIDQIIDKVYFSGFTQGIIPFKKSLRPLILHYRASSLRKTGFGAVKRAWVLF